MRLLLDTHVLLWAAYTPNRLGRHLIAELEDEHNELVFSAASIWEVAIKAGLARADFDVDAGILRRELIENGYSELPIAGTHCANVSKLPAIHRDPFDRILIAQARTEGLTLLTADRAVADYGPPARHIDGR